jgi:hypothetical protein
MPASELLTIHRELPKISVHLATELVEKDSIAGLLLRNQLVAANMVLDFEGRETRANVATAPCTPWAVYHRSDR